MVRITRDGANAVFQTFQIRESVQKNLPVVIISPFHPLLSLLKIMKSQIIAFTNKLDDGNSIKKSSRFATVI